MAKTEQLSDLSMFGFFTKQREKTDPVDAMAEMILHTATHPDSEARYYLSYNDGRGSQSDLFGFLEGWRQDTLYFRNWPADKKPIDVMALTFEKIADQKNDATLVDQMYFAAHCVYDASNSFRRVSKEAVEPDHALANKMLNAFARAARRLPEDAYSYEDSRHEHRWSGLSRGHYVSTVARAFPVIFKGANFEDETHKNWDSYRARANPKIESWVRESFARRTPEQAAAADAGRDEKVLRSWLVPALNDQPT